MRYTHSFIVVMLNWSVILVISLCNNVLFLRTFFFMIVEQSIFLTFLSFSSKDCTSVLVFLKSYFKQWSWVDVVDSWISLYQNIFSQLKNDCCDAAVNLAVFKIYQVFQISTIEELGLVTHIFRTCSRSYIILPNCNFLLCLADRRLRWVGG